MQFKPPNHQIRHKIKIRNRNEIIQIWVIYAFVLELRNVTQPQLISLTVMRSTFYFDTT